MQVTKFNLVTDLQIMLSNVTHSSFLFECNTKRGCIDQLYIELGRHPIAVMGVADRFGHYPVAYLLAYLLSAYHKYVFMTDVFSSPPLLLSSYNFRLKISKIVHCDIA